MVIIDVLRIAEAESNMVRVKNAVQPTSLDRRFAFSLGSHGALPDELDLDNCPKLSHFLIAHGQRLALHQQVRNSEYIEAGLWHGIFATGGKDSFWRDLHKLDSAACPYLQICSVE